jgi:hypothetical protein
MIGTSSLSSSLLLLLALVGTGCTPKTTDTGEDDTDVDTDSGVPADDTAPDDPDADGDSYPASTDCDDTDADVSPGATEVCNDVDDDCDGTVDEAGAADEQEWHLDDDGDGFGDPTPVFACNAPHGSVDDATDCDDSRTYVSPAATEACNGFDDDCDGDVDESGATGETDWYLDLDEDGYGDGDPTLACDLPDGFVAVDGDCDDDDALINPGEMEVCDGVDQDCNGDVDELPAVGTSTYYLDADGDGYGTSAGRRSACEAPAGYVSVSGDCNDANAAIAPGLTETCDGVDQDCDGRADEDAVDTVSWHPDSDGDGYGASGVTVTACTAPSGYLADASDCDDTDTSVSPDGVEVCNSADDDCNGAVDDDAVDVVDWYVDVDGDGYGIDTVAATACDQPASAAAVSGDCDDTAATVFPGAAETCDDIDDDCDGNVDEDVLGLAPWYRDADSDGYGDPAVTRAGSCDTPAGYVADATDCDDGDGSVSPAGVEVCNGHDDDCDGGTDLGATDALTWYLDGDADGFGQTASTTTACTQPAGYVGEGADCDDADAAVSPDALETCNGVDDDCDGAVDSSVDGGNACDSDGDGLSDDDEEAGTTTGFVTDPLLADTDGDGVDDDVDAAPITAACSTTLYFYDDFKTDPIAGGWSVLRGTWSWDGIDTWSETDTIAGANAWVGAELWDDTVTEVRLKTNSGTTGDAGLLTRVQSVSAIVDRGTDVYFGLQPGSDTVIWGYHDSGWNLLANYAEPNDLGTWYTLQLRSTGSEHSLYVDGTLVQEATLEQPDIGSVGLRASNMPTTFDYVLVCD